MKTYTTSSLLLLSCLNILPTTTAYTLRTSILDGLFADINIGSSPVLFAIDTTFPDILVTQNYTSTTLYNSSTAFNFSSIDREYATGILAYDEFDLFSALNESDPIQLSFGFANQDNILINSRKVISGSQIMLSTTSQDKNSFSPNILGLNVYNDEGRSLLSQLLGHNMSTSSLYSIRTDEPGYFADISFGEINTKFFHGPITLLPFLKTSFVTNPRDTEYKYPFVQLSGITLKNYEHSTSLNITVSSSDISIPTLLDSNNLISYLPYSLVVDIASQFNAFYSKDHMLWIQSCDFRKINGSIGFTILDSFTVNIPLKDLFVPLVNSETSHSLYLSNGDLACALAFGSSSVKGYSSLGIPFFRNVYSIFDYTNNMVGLAKKRNVSLNPEDLDEGVIKVYNDIGAVYSRVSTVTYDQASFTPTAVMQYPTVDYTVTQTGSDNNYRLLTSAPSETSAQNSSQQTFANTVAGDFPNDGSDSSSDDGGSGEDEDGGSNGASNNPSYIIGQQYPTATTTKKDNNAVSVTSGSNFEAAASKNSVGLLNLIIIGIYMMI